MPNDTTINVAAQAGRDSLLVIIAAPSGTGKSTIARALFHRRPGMAFSVSHTTRSPRPNEREGKHYYFAAGERFDALVAEDGFAEWAHVHQQRYGTSKAEVKRLSDAGRDILFDVDVQGAKQLMVVYPEAVTIFVVPPSLEELERRLRGRGTETEEQLATRLANAQGELTAAQVFGYVVINDDLEHAVHQVEAICEAESCKRSRNHGLMAQVQQMVEG